MHSCSAQSNESSEIIVEPLGYNLKKNPKILNKCTIVKFKKNKYIPSGIYQEAERYDR